MNTQHEVVLLCKGPAVHVGGRCRHIEAIVVDEVFIWPVHLPDYAMQVLKRFVFARSPQQAVRKFRDWQKHGRGEPWLTEWDSRYCEAKERV